MKPKKPNVVRYPRTEITAVEKFIQEHDGEFTKSGLSDHLSTMMEQTVVEEIIGFLLYRHRIHVDKHDQVHWVLGSAHTGKGDGDRAAAGNAAGHADPRVRKSWSTREEANAMTCFAFRNGFLEELHAGKHSELLENSGLSRITDAEMKKLMIEASQKMAELLTMKEKEPEKYWHLITWTNEKYCKKWDK